MKTYVTTTGVLFAFIALAHIWRVVSESRQLATDPWFLGMTLIAAALSLWAWRLLRGAATS